MFLLYYICVVRSATVTESASSLATFTLQRSLSATPKRVRWMYQLHFGILALQFERSRVPSRHCVRRARSFLTSSPAWLSHRQSRCVTETSTVLKTVSHFARSHTVLLRFRSEPRLAFQCT
jgi:hypothetical protein